MADGQAVAPPVRGRLKGDKLRAAGGGLAERAARRLQGLQHEVAHLKEHAQREVAGLQVPGASRLRMRFLHKLPASHSSHSN